MITTFHFQNMKGLALTSKMKTEYRIVSTVLASLHFAFYGFWIIAIIINPETWFFGEKFAGYEAITIHLTIESLGMLIGFLVYRNNNISYFAGIVLFVIAVSSILVNHFSCWEFDLYCN